MTLQEEHGEIIMYSNDGGRVINLGPIRNIEEVTRLVYKAMKIGEENARKEIRNALGLV